MNDNTQDASYQPETTYCSSGVGDLVTTAHACAVPLTYFTDDLGLSAGTAILPKVRGKCATVDGAWSDPTTLAVGTDTVAIPS